MPYGVDTGFRNCLMTAPLQSRLGMFKNFQVGEHVRATFPAEAYNVFNHTQFNAVNLAPQ